jgi:hypothetical protein
MERQPSHIRHLPEIRRFAALRQLSGVKPTSRGRESRQQLLTQSRHGVADGIMARSFVNLQGPASFSAFSPKPFQGFSRYRLRTPHLYTRLVPPSSPGAGFGRPRSESRSSYQEAFKCLRNAIFCFVPQPSLQ